MGDDTQYQITHMGQVPVKLDSRDVKIIKNVLYVLYITRNLILVGQMVDQNLQVTLNSKRCFIQDMNDNMKVVTTRTKIDQMFKFRGGKSS